MLRIQRNLSTAAHPQTDGETERMNTGVENFIRVFTNHAQDDWGMLLNATQLSLANWDSSSLGMSPFFLDHGYNLEVLELDEQNEPAVARTPRERGERIARKLKEALDIAQAEMAAA